MKRKMDLLERAHGLLCNAPSDSTSAEQGEEWHKLRAQWIEEWTAAVRAHATKHHNRRIQIGNEAINEYEQRRGSTS